MNRYFLLVAAALFLFSGCSKLTGEMGTAHFSTTSSYTKLDVSNAFDVSFSDEVSDVTVTADEEIMSKIVVEESDGTLVIRVKALASARNSVKKVLLPPNGNISDVTLSGDSKLHIDFSSSEVELSLSGNSVVYASGACGELELELSGESSVESDHGSTYAFAPERVEGALSGGSKAAFHCDGAINVALSGGSTIRYTGDANTAGCKLTGGSNVIHDVF